MLRTSLLTTTVALGIGAFPPTTASLAALAATQATPGYGSVTDCSGNTYVITGDGSVLEDGTDWVPGGGGTAALQVQACTVYGLDATGRGWFSLSENGSAWTPTAPPQATTPSTTAPSASPPSTSGTANTLVAATPTIPTNVTLPAVTLPAPNCSANYTPLSGAAGTGFHVAGGQIIGPNGQPFIARGINYGVPDTSTGTKILAAYSGLNFIRLSTWYTAPYTMSQYQSFISMMTAKGVVVEIEDHAYTPNGDPVYTGAQLAAETAWFASVAAAFKTDPYVWFGTMNEPKGSGADITAQEVAIYNAIRGAGNNSIIMIEAGLGGGVPGSVGASFQNPASFANMTNIVWDLHYYGWASGYSTDQTTVNNELNTLISAAQTIKSADGTVPVLIGEYGNSTNGSSTDANGTQVVSAVINLGGALKNGSAAWEWSSVASDALLNSDGSLSTYGQLVELYINVPCPAATATLN